MRTTQSTFKMNIVETIDHALSFIAHPDSPIFPIPQNIETTKMLSKRLKRPPSTVVHNTNWSDIFHVLPNPTDWEFTIDSKRNLKDRDGWTIDIFSPTESRKLIELTELYGYEHCGYPEDYRNNARTITSDPMFAAKLFDRIKGCFPPQYNHDGQIWKLCGLNERFRWCKYVERQKFEMHCDARFARNSECKSFYTVNVYLNDGNADFEGGRTLFYCDGESVCHDWRGRLVNDISVTATPGLALVFNHWPESIMHSGEPLTKGVKYLMRTDAMYQKVDSGL